MPPTVVFAVGVDPSVLVSQRSVRQSAGCYVTSAGSIREAIVQLGDGDLDLILLGDSVPIESRERLTFLIRASRSQIASRGIVVAAGPGHAVSFCGSLKERFSGRIADVPCTSRTEAMNR